MEKKEILYPGTDLKFRITAEIPGFDIQEHGFSLDILSRRGRVRRTIDRQECFCDSEGAWYFTLENVRKGPVFVRFNAAIPDDDYDKRVRVVTDLQLLAVVGMCGCMMPCHCDCTHSVRYAQVWTVNLDDGTYLCDVNGELILTADGCRIQVKP